MLERQMDSGILSDRLPAVNIVNKEWDTVIG